MRVLSTRNTINSPLGYGFEIRPGSKEDQIEKGSRKSSRNTSYPFQFTVPEEVGKEVGGDGEKLKKVNEQETHIAPEGYSVLQKSAPMAGRTTSPSSTFPPRASSRLHSAFTVDCESLMPEYLNFSEGGVYSENLPSTFPVKRSSEQDCKNVVKKAEARCPSGLSEPQQARRVPALLHQIDGGVGDYSIPHATSPANGESPCPRLRLQALLVDSVDEYAITQTKEFEGNKLIRMSKEGLELEETQERKTACKKEADDFAPPSRTSRSQVEKVVVSDRNTDSPCVLLTAQLVGPPTRSIS
ncbi:Heat-shock protein 90 [Mycena sanguinolenta]|uniref:Heat-shock protein 90 n=1 Tax=Mycena sanguinolenta TaxID=230812 RepID=A0A8H7D7E8_9AGAR|nr:Heat-shock protein 90 [Mycena sanguinolenta]